MTWAVHISCGSRSGTGGVLTSTLVVTAWHVVKNARHATIRWAGRSLAVTVVDCDPDLDVVILALTEGGLALAPELVLIPRELWRGSPPKDDALAVELCTSDDRTPRSLSIECRRDNASPGSSRVQFWVDRQREGVRAGYSGGPVVEHGVTSAQPRMIGIVRARDTSSIDVLDNAGGGWFVPVERIAERFHDVANLVEAPFERGPVWNTHWEPRSRGVPTSGDFGFYFSGRHRAYNRVREHLSQPPGLLAVLGDRGHGKSAVLARVVMLSTRRHLTLLGNEVHEAVGEYDRPSMPVQAAVLARNKSVDQVATDLGQQLGLRARSSPELLGDLVGARGTRIVIDGVDESEDPGQLIRDLIVKLVGDARCAVVIAALARNIHADLPDTATRVDLDAAPYRDDAVSEYVARRLRVLPAYSARGQRVVADAVSQRAKNNFLVAEVQVRTLMENPIDTTAADWRAKLREHPRDAFRDYLGRFGALRSFVVATLHPLAHAQNECLPFRPPELWLQVANALSDGAHGELVSEDVRRVCREATDYLVLGFDPRDHRRKTWQLYHEDLGAAIRILAAEERLLRQGSVWEATAVTDELAAASERFVASLEAMLPADEKAVADEYDRLDPYLLEHLADHLAQGGRVSMLLARPGFLLSADQEKLGRALVRGALSIPGGLEPVRAAVAHALAKPREPRSQRAAALCVALRRQGARDAAEGIRRAQGAESGDRFSDALPYELVTAPPLPPIVTIIGNAHVGRISALERAEHDGEALLLSASEDGELYSWRLDGRSGPLRISCAHVEGITALVVLAEHQPDPLVVTAGADGSIRSWRFDGSPGAVLVLQAHRGAITAVASTEHDGQPLLISAGDDGSLSSWRPDNTRGPFSQELGPGNHVSALAVVASDTGTVIVGGSATGAVLSWRLSDGQRGPLIRPQAHSSFVSALLVAEDAGGPLVVSASRDGSVRGWRLNAAADSPVLFEPAQAPGDDTTALAMANLDGVDVLVGGTRHGTLESWTLDGRSGPLTLHHAHPDWIQALMAIHHAEAGPLLFSGGDDRSLRGWRLARGDVPPHPHAHDGPIRAIRTMDHGGEPLVVSAGIGGALLSWRMDGRVGPLATNAAHPGAIFALAGTCRAGAQTVVTGGADGGVKAWRILDAEEAPGHDGRMEQSWVEHPHQGPVRALTIVSGSSGPVVFSAGRDGALRSHLLAGGPGPCSIAHAHHGPIMCLAALQCDGIQVVLSAGADGAIRSWRLDGSDGGYTRENAHVGTVKALVVVDYDGTELVVSAGADGAVRSWGKEGESGPFEVNQAHRGWILALTVAAAAGAPLVVSAGEDGAVRSWSLDGRAGPLCAPQAHDGAIHALAVLEYREQTMVISGGEDRAILAHVLPR